MIYLYYINLMNIYSNQIESIYLIHLNLSSSYDLNWNSGLRYWFYWFDIWKSHLDSTKWFLCHRVSRCVTGASCAPWAPWAPWASAAFCACHFALCAWQHFMAQHGAVFCGRSLGRSRPHGNPPCLTSPLAGHCPSVNGRRGVCTSNPCCVPWNQNLNPLLRTAESWIKLNQVVILTVVHCGTFFIILRCLHCVNGFQKQSHTMSHLAPC